MGQIHLLGLPEPARQFRFAPPRQWRADFAYPQLKLLIEVEGGVWTHGRHTRPSGFVRDIAKYNRAAELGYRLIRFAGDMIHSGEALATIERMVRK
ncbi:MAG: hypothetical protein ACREJC_18785 [Tepidisphaeraceae bacterium]